MDNRANVNKHVDKVPLLRVLLLPLPAMSSSAKASCTVELFFNYSARLHENELMQQQQQQQRLLYLKTQSNTEIQTKEQLPLSPTCLYTLLACH